MNRLIFILILLNMVISCKKDPCEGIYCYNNGICNDGKCNCPPGYSGEYCEIIDQSGGNTNKGQIIFWEQEGSYCSINTQVSINGITKEISSFFYSGKEPDNCNHDGSAIFTLTSGTYNYSAICNGTTKTGRVTITSGNCQYVKLVWSGGGGGGGTICPFSNTSPSQANILNFLSGFNYTGSLTNIAEAEQMLKYLCNDVQIHFLNSASTVCGKYPNGYHITVSPNSYNQPSIYGVRFGLEDNHNFYTSNNTYFEINKGGNSGGSPTSTSPNTTFLASQCYRFSSPLSYWTQQFTVNVPTSFVLRFSPQYSADASIFVPSQLSNFQTGKNYTGLAGFDNQFGFEYLNLQPGTYYLGMRNQSSGTNRASIEFDYDISLPSSDRCSFVENNFRGYENIAAYGKYWNSFTISSGYRYFIDGCNSGDLQVYIIDQNQLNLFKNNQSFQYYSDYYLPDCGPNPGLDELKLPPGTYYIVASNLSNDNQTINYVMEKWRQN